MTGTSTMTHLKLTLPELWQTNDVLKASQSMEEVVGQIRRCPYLISSWQPGLQILKEALKPTLNPWAHPDAVLWGPADTDFDKHSCRGPQQMLSAPFPESHVLGQPPMLRTANFIQRETGSAACQTLLWL